MDFSNHPEYGENYGANAEFTDQPNNDTELFQKLVAYMKEHHPPLVFAILGGAKSFNKIRRPDEMARYRKQLKEMDKTIYDIWQFIQGDEHYKDKTDFFFISDHGDLIDHEDCDDECKRYLVMVALGPDIKNNFTSTDKWRQTNVCPTVGAILGFPTPFVDKKSEVMTDILLK